MTKDPSAELERIRAEIEAIDHDIVAMVAKRLQLCREVAPLKVSAGLEAHIPHRVKLVVDRWVRHASEHGIDQQLVRSICEQVIAEGEKLQVQEMHAAGPSPQGAS